MYFNCLFSYYACTFMLFAYLNLNMCTNKNFRNIYSGQCIDCSWVVTFEESVLKREENPLMIQFPHSHTGSYVIHCRMFAIFAFFTQVLRRGTGVRCVRPCPVRTPRSTADRCIITGGSTVSGAPCHASQSASAPPPPRGTWDIAGTGTPTAACIGRLSTSQTDGGVSSSVCWPVSLDSSGELCHQL